MTDDLDPRVDDEGRSITGDESSFETNDALRPDPEVRFSEEDAGGGSAGSRQNAGYTGGVATGNQDAVGMRQVVADEASGERPASEAAAGGDETPEPPANLAQQDQ